MSAKLTYITSHPKKAKEISLYLKMPILHKKIDVEEIQSLNPDEVVRHKAEEAYRLVESLVLVEDYCLTFKALGRLPGPLIKWFLVELGPDGMCELLNGYEDRSALAQVYFAIYDGKNMQVFSSEIEGSIAKSPQGEYGFGTDCIFIPKGYSKTWGEMNANELMETSIRNVALTKLQKYLKSK